jgi:ParB family chromosome partitioning protein
MPLDQLHPSPTNPRKHLGDLTELAASLAQVGVLEPLVARPSRAPTSRSRSGIGATRTR